MASQILSSVAATKLVVSSRLVADPHSLGLSVHPAGRKTNFYLILIAYLCTLLLPLYVELGGGGRGGDWAFQAGWKTKVYSLLVCSSAPCIGWVSGRTVCVFKQGGKQTCS